MLRPVGSDDLPGGTDTPSIDIDNDGTPNVTDNDIDNDGTPNTQDTDIDGDKIPNTSDTDIDGDNVINIDDNDIDGDGIPNTQDTDIDGDGTPNISDTDIDGDNVINIDDNDIDGDGIPNTQDADIDGDGVINVNDSDIDGDGIPNKDDNDIDGDGIPNNQDPDIDNDGAPNAQDQTPGGTGTETGGTQGTTNDGTDANNGTVNTDDDRNNGDTDDEYVSGIGIVAIDTVTYGFTIPSSQSTGTVSRQETVNLGDVRDAIKDADIALSTFSLANLSVSASRNGFVAANTTTRIVVTVSYLEGGVKVPVLVSADREGLAGPVLTINDLANGLQLNQEIFAASQGFVNFTDMIKDESKSTVETVVDINFLDAPAQGAGGLDVRFIMTATGKKPL
jgi:hypothetical protein